MHRPSESPVTGSLLRALHAGQFIPQQQGSLGHIGYNDIGAGAQCLHRLHQISAQPPVHLPAVAHNRVHDLQRIGP